MENLVIGADGYKFLNFAGGHEYLKCHSLGEHHPSLCGD